MIGGTQQEERRGKESVTMAEYGKNKLYVSMKIGC
jgi:hypothetical protein